MPLQQSDYRPEYCQVAIHVLSQGRSLAAVCAELDISRMTLYRWREANEDFAEALSRGLQKCQAYWEEIGMSGTRGDIDKFVPSTYAFTVKNRFREDYAEEKEKSSTEVLIDKLIDKLVD